MIGSFQPLKVKEKSKSISELKLNSVLNPIFPPIILTKPHPYKHSRHESDDLNKKKRKFINFLDVEAPPLKSELHNVMLELKSPSLRSPALSRTPKPFKMPGSLSLNGNNIKVAEGNPNPTEEKYVVEGFKINRSGVMSIHPNNIIELKNPKKSRGRGVTIRNFSNSNDKIALEQEQNGKDNLTAKTISIAEDKGETEDKEVSSFIGERKKFFPRLPNIDLNKLTSKEQIIIREFYKPSKESIQTRLTIKSAADCEFSKLKYKGYMLRDPEIVVNNPQRLFENEEIQRELDSALAQGESDLKELMTAGSVTDRERVFQKLQSKSYFIKVYVEKTAGRRKYFLKDVGPRQVSEAHRLEEFKLLCEISSTLLTELGKDSEHMKIFLLDSKMSFDYMTNYIKEKWTSAKGKRLALAVLRESHEFFNTPRNDTLINRLLLSFGLNPENDLSVIAWNTYRDFSRLINGDHPGTQELLDICCNFIFISSDSIQPEELRRLLYQLGKSYKPGKEKSKSLRKIFQKALIDVVFLSLEFEFPESNFSKIIKLAELRKIFLKVYINVNAFMKVIVNSL